MPILAPVPKERKDVDEIQNCQSVSQWRYKILEVKMPMRLRYTVCSTSLCCVNWSFGWIYQRNQILELRWTKRTKYRIYQSLGNLSSVEPRFRKFPGHRVLILGATGCFLGCGGRALLVLLACVAGRFSPSPYPPLFAPAIQASTLQ